MMINLGGLKLSYLSFKNLMNNTAVPMLKLPNLKFSFEQLFWVINAQVWCSHYDNSNLIKCKINFYQDFIHF